MKRELNNKTERHRAGRPRGAFLSEVTRWRHRTGRCTTHRAPAVADYHKFSWWVAWRDYPVLARREREEVSQTIELIVLLAERREHYDRLGAKRFKRLARKELTALGRALGYRHVHNGGMWQRFHVPLEEGKNEYLCQSYKSPQ